MLETQGCFDLAGVQFPIDATARCSRLGQIDLGSTLGLGASPQPLHLLANVCATSISTHLHAGPQDHPGHGHAAEDEDNGHKPPNSHSFPPNSR